MDVRITGPVTKDDAHDVSDPTDWLGTPLASLVQVEQSLRCHVCKDFFNSPVITSCSHTFCSLCIRRALNADGKCPLCRATDQESKLRGNWAIREAVDTFVASRGVMLDLARQPTIGDPAAFAATPKRKSCNEPTNGDSVTKRVRMSTRSSSARAAATTTAMMQEEADVLEAEAMEDYIPGMIPPTLWNERQEPWLIWYSDDGLVPCPICLWRMKPEKVDRHLDTDCPGEPRPQPEVSKPKNLNFATARSIQNSAPMSSERLPSTNYSILNETKLRKRLSDLGIPTWGSRLLMEKRHREWVMIWNANCDSARPKTKRELLQDLDTWERTQGGQAPTMSVSANLGAQIKDKDFDGAGWSAKHSDSFSDLIARARKSHKKVEVGEKPLVTSSSSENVEGSGYQHANGTGQEQTSDVLNTKEAYSEGSQVKIPTTINLISPSKPREHRRTSLLSTEERSATEVDTVINSALTETPT